MAVTKRLRFEILRRDNHACRYCGATAPCVALAVDHVLPVALGGTDDPTNLVTACKDCNAGKSSSHPDQPLVADVANDAIRWARARQLAADTLWQNQVDRAKAITDVLDVWHDTFHADYNRVPDVAADAEQSIGTWLDRGLQRRDMYHLIIEVTARKVGRVSWSSLWTYFAGCCWTRLREIETAAQAMIDRGAV